jgi:hypothetical protein
MNNKDLINKLNKAAQKIAHNSRYGGANFIVTSSEVAHAMRGLVIDTAEEKRKEREKKIKRILGSEK